MQAMFADKFNLGWWTVPSLFMGSPQTKTPSA